jgi:hypothetical protein
MKKILIFCFFLSIAVNSPSQIWKNYNLKAEFSYGAILKHSKHLENLVNKPVYGGELAVEFQTKGDKEWHQYYNFPVVGAGLSYFNLGNPELLGHSLALYPYINIPIIRGRIFTFNFKSGAGISYVTKTFHNTHKPDMSLDNANAAIGSHLNVYFSGGINIDFSISSQVKLAVDASWNHMSNGSFTQPNSGLNIFNGFVGIKYYPDAYGYQPVQAKVRTRINRKMAFDVTLSGGARELYYRDENRYLIASLNTGIYYPLLNWYRMGLGGDLFYDGAYNGKTFFKRTYLHTDKLKNKLRAGISWRNEIEMGRLIVGIHLGLYIYNPLKNLEPYRDAERKTLKKPLIYKYDIEKEDGWLYTRLVMKYAFSEHFFAAIALKTHLQKAEFIEWGIGYCF